MSDERDVQKTFTAALGETLRMAELQPETPEAMLKMVLEREAATAARYDERIEALEAALADSEAKVARLVEALRRIADHLPLFDYVGSDDFGSRHDLPGSPYDRGKAHEADLLSGIARAALASVQGEVARTGAQEGEG